MTILNILLKDIESNPWQTRTAEPDPEYIKALALDIAKNGLLQIPIGRYVYHDPNPTTTSKALPKPHPSRYYRI